MTTLTDRTRFERDALGEVQLPADSLHGIHTARAVDYLVVERAEDVLPRLRAALAGIAERDMSMAVSPDVM